MTADNPAGPVLGLDIGGTKLAAAVVSQVGEVLTYRRAPSRTWQGAETVVSRLFRLGHAAIEQAGMPIAAVGIACGGPLDARAGVILSPPGLPDWTSVPITGPAAAEFAAPAFLDNDGTAAAYAEYLFGPWKLTQSLAYLTISTGIGGGLVLQGRPYRGSTGNGAEFGHLAIDWKGRRCNCGQSGCAEAYVSGRAIGARAAEGLARGTRSSLRGPTVTAELVAEAAAGGDAFASSIWEESMEMLGRVVAMVINTVEPDLVVLGGGVTQAGGMFIEPVRRHALSQVMSPSVTRTRVQLTALRDHGGVLGAAAVARDRMANQAWLDRVG